MGSRTTLQNEKELQGSKQKGKDTRKGEQLGPLAQLTYHILWLLIPEDFS